MGGAAQRLLKPNKLVVKLGQLFGAKVTPDGSAESACRHFNGGANPIAVPVADCFRIPAAEQHDS
jgi:hypothetical protein